MRNASLSISNHKDMPVSLYADPLDHYEYTGGSGMTAEAALVELRMKLPTLANLAKSKRAQAERLIAEAAKLEGTQ
jgi:hypothetical protein